MLSIEQGKDYDDVDEKDLPYIHVQQLGHGHSGTVEEVKDQMTGQVYARKTIRITGSKKNRAERSRVFWNEVSIIRGLGSHRHIIGIHATYVTRRDFGILLWPVASEGDLETFLDNYIQHAGELPQTGDSTSLVKSMAPILEQGFGCLVSGLAFMHKNRIRHKDIKPRNILVHRGSLIYTDFGYSFDSNGFSHSTTEGRPDFLTRRYSPPESLQHEERNSKSDIYSLGCVLLDIFVALTQAINYDENALFSSVMSSIHEQLDLASVPLKWVFVPPVLKSMTMLARQDRPSAHHLMTIFQAHEGFFCNVCGPSETECSTGVTFSSYTRKLQALALNLDTEPTGSNNTFHLESNPGTASMSPYYTPWTWSETHKLYYCSRLSGDKILDTLWAHRSTAGSLFFSPEPETPSYNSAMQTMSIEVPHSNVDTISSGGVGVTYPPRPYTSSPQPIVSSDHVTLNNRSVTLPEDVQTRSQNMEQRFTLPRVESRVKLDAGETLDPRFRRVVRQHHKNFFALGRVFKMLWIEPAGPANPGRTRNSTHYTTSAFGEPSYNEIRSYVVVRNKETFSQCIPIRTYRGRGAAKLGLNMHDHGIVHSSEQVPDLLPGENLINGPIRVELSATNDVHLDAASRVNYGKPYAVEHNVKVRDIGMVVEEHRGLITGYFDSAMRG